MPDEDDDKKPVADDPDAELEDGVLSLDREAEKEIAGVTSTRLPIDEVLDDDEPLELDDPEEEEEASDDEM